jgi:hypothetical protein
MRLLNTCACSLLFFSTSPTIVQGRNVLAAFQRACLEAMHTKQASYKTVLELETVIIPYVERLNAISSFGSARRKPRTGPPAPVPDQRLTDAQIISPS